MSKKTFNILLNIVIAIIVISLIIVAYNYKNKLTRVSELGNNSNKRVNIVGYMSPMMKEDYSFFYLSQKPYDYDLDSNSVVGCYSNLNYGYSEYISVVTGNIEKADRDKFDVVKIYGSGEEVGYITKEDLTQDKLDIINGEGIKHEYLFSDESGNTFKYKLNVEKIKPYSGSEYREQNEILEDGYVTIVNGLLAEVADRLGISDISEADKSIGYEQLEPATQSNIEKGVNTDSALALEGRLKKLNGYDELVEIVDKTLDIYNKTVDVESLSQSDKEKYNDEAKDLYRKFLNSFEKLSV